MSESVACILFSENKSRVLLIKRRDIPVWVLPGGGIDPGETPEEASIREMLEESGYHTRIVRKVADYSPKNRLSKRVHFFEVERVSGEARVGSETREIAFFDRSNLPKRLAPPYPYWIADAALGLKEVIRKPVEGVSYWVLVKLLILHPLLVARFLLTRLGIHINS